MVFPVRDVFRYTTQSSLEHRSQPQTLRSRTYYFVGSTSHHSLFAWHPSNTCLGRYEKGGGIERSSEAHGTCDVRRGTPVNSAACTIVSREGTNSAAPAPSHRTSSTQTQPDLYLQTTCTTWPLLNTSPRVWRRPSRSSADRIFCDNVERLTDTCAWCSEQRHFLIFSFFQPVPCAPATT